MKLSHAQKVFLVVVALAIVVIGFCGESGVTVAIGMGALAVIAFVALGNVGKKKPSL